jgi:hypothetical protein
VANTGDYNFSMWSWCGELSSATESYIQSYLDTLNQFEAEYPDMRFIYMTGHLDGTGSGGNLHVRNEQIRNYCIANNKMLFDFADIERYDPDGNDYLDLGANDNCDYSGGNWAQQWCAAHPGSDLCASCSCAHSQALNCNMKARAFWWMMARVAGWNPSGGGNQHPVADAGLDRTVNEGTTVTLDGTNSYDPDGTIVSYYWTQETGVTVTLSDRTDPHPSFVTPPVDYQGTTLTFQVTVQDNGGLEDTDLVSVTINDNGITGFPADVITMISSTGESIGIKEDSGGDLVYLEAIDPSTISDTTNRPENLVYGLIEIKIKSNTIGGTVKVTFYLPMPAPDEYKCYKYSPKRGWYDYNNHADFNNNRDQVTLTLIDGGIGDDDDNADGVIVDPIGFGTAPSTPVSPVGRGNDGCFIATAAYGSHMTQEVKALLQFRDNVLMKNSLGKHFVKFYYKFSPSIAGYLHKHPSARAIVRYALIPITGIAYISLSIHPIALLFAFFFMLMAGIYCARRLSRPRNNSIL